MAKTFESLIGAAMLLAGLLLFLVGMVLRWIGSGMGGAWVEEVTIYLVVWGTLLSAASGVALNEHVRADFFLRLLGERMHGVADILAAVAGLAFCATLGWLGGEVVAFAFRWDERGPSMLQIPTAWFYAALPASMCLCAFRYLIQVVEIISGRATREAGH